MAKSQAKQKNRPFRPLLVIIVATVLLILFLVVALLLAPKDHLPEFSITDRMGSWEEQGPLDGIFDGDIHPGRSGEYKFILKNESEVTLRYGIKLTEYLETSVTVLPFMRYRLKRDGEFLGNEKGEWHTLNEIETDINNLETWGITILPGTEQLFILEWYWPYESGNDENDTLVGVAGGNVNLHFFIWAQVEE